MCSVERSRCFGMSYQAVNMSWRIFNACQGRHNQVLKILVEAMEAALAKAATTKDTTECWIPATIKDVKRIIDQNVLADQMERKEEKHYKLVEKRVSVKSVFQCASRKKEEVWPNLGIV